MLRVLDIRDILIIDQIELAFRPGLNVLTGETGAGKSILLDALGFVLGWRGRAELVRQGASQGEVIAVFDLIPDHSAHRVLDEAGLPGGDELILRRINTADGRKTAWVNDRRTSGEVLRALSDCLVELHGQHDDKGLLNPRGHRQLLDSFAETAPLCAATRTAWRDLAAAHCALADRAAALETARAEEDFLRHAVAELDQIDPQPGEDAALDIARRRMQEAEKIKGDIARAHALLGPDAAEGAMSDAVRWLEGAGDQAGDGIEAPLAALNRALIELSDAQSGVEQLLDQLAFSPAELEETEERLFALRALGRKHRVQAEDLPGFAETLRARLNAIDKSAENIATLANEAKAAESTYAAAAQALSHARHAAATRLDQAVMAELAPLKMERAVFETQLTPADPGPDGTDAAAFTVATNPGAPAGPLNKIASGGELSRFLMALRVCLTTPGAGMTMIFDEIDRGVGGATADAVGRRLAALAETGQVLVVTHSPQVAAKGAHHWQVAKRVTDGLTVSAVTPLAGAARIDEIARMLAGDTITDEARGAARALLAD